MNNLFTRFILFFTIFALCACVQKTETTSRVPAQLEVVWASTYQSAEDLRPEKLIPAELKARLLAIGDFKYDYTLSSRDNKTTLTINLKFNREITIDNADEIVTQLKDALGDKFQSMKFQGAQTTKTIKEELRFF